MMVSSYSLALIQSVAYFADWSTHQYSMHQMTRVL